ncbi:MAG: hypothetical protein A2X86_06065 [Bdellovibrionales bacterium GWA2_49_15]|nr:MAG: hypothetical protein A2X86_06065 [Bdellovibrionales bacterium GWA2_49_15]
MKNSNQNASVFINGRAQIIEMLQLMDPSEKEKILKLIRIKNPVLAEELHSKSISFFDIQNLSEEGLERLSGVIKPAIFGMALKGLAANVQKKFLSSLPREFAEQAYQTMTTYYTNEKELGARARAKVLEIASSQAFRGKIS